MVTENGVINTVSFWPADEIAAALGKPEELRELRLFARTMNYFYEQASKETCDIGGNEMAELCRLAKKGLIAELGMVTPEGETA